jgi:hypothetical protein
MESCSRLERRLYAALLATKQLAVFRATAETDLAPFVEIVLPHLRPPLPASIPALLEGLRKLHQRLKKSRATACCSSPPIVWEA